MKISIGAKKNVHGMVRYLITTSIDKDLPLLPK